MPPKVSHEDALKDIDELPTEGKVCASRARDEYHIPDRVLAHLEPDYCRNPHYRSAAPMRLYERQAVEEEALTHHEDKLAEERQRAAKQKAKAEKSAKRQAQYEQAGSE